MFEDALAVAPTKAATAMMAAFKAAVAAMPEAVAHGVAGFVSMEMSEKQCSLLS